MPYCPQPTPRWQGGGMTRGATILPMPIKWSVVGALFDWQNYPLTDVLCSNQHIIDRGRYYADLRTETHA